MINSKFLLLRLICLSENVLEIMTLIRSSGGKFIFISIKLSNLDFKSFKLILISLTFLNEFIIIILFNCKTWFINE